MRVRNGHWIRCVQFVYVVLGKNKESYPVEDVICPACHMGWGPTLRFHVLLATSLAVQRRLVRLGSLRSYCGIACLQQHVELFFFMLQSKDVVLTYVALVVEPAAVAVGTTVPVSAVDVVPATCDAVFRKTRVEKSSGDPLLHVLLLTIAFLQLGAAAAAALVQIF